MIWKNMNESCPNLFSSNTEKKTFKLDFATVVDNYNWIIAKNSNKRLKWRVAQCLRSYFVLLRGRVLFSLVSEGEVKKVK